MTEKTLWQEFNLGANNPDQAGGLLYAMRYSTKVLDVQHQAVVGALQNMGVSLVEENTLVGNLIGAQLSNGSFEAKNKALLLLEELSVVNAAQEYHEAGYGNVKSIEELSGKLIGDCFSLLDQKEMAKAYHLAGVVIPEIFSDMCVAHVQSKATLFSDKEIHTLEELAKYGSRQAKMLDNPRRFVLFG